MQSNDRQKVDPFAFLGLLLAIVFVLTGPAPETASRPRRYGKRLIQLVVLGFAGYGLFTVASHLRWE